MSQLMVTLARIYEHLALLEATPRRIAHCTAMLDDSVLAEPSGERVWSPLQILAHLRACDDLWSFSIYMMLSQDNPVLPDLDVRRWAKATKYESLSFHTSFLVFELKRMELLRVLRNLPEEEWKRSALIDGRTHTVFSQARRMGKHETEHCSQIEMIVREEGS